MLGSDRAGGQLVDLVSEGVLEVLGGLDALTTSRCPSSGGSDGAEQVVVREAFPGLDAGRRVDRLTFAKSASIEPARSSDRANRRTTSKSQPNGSFANSSARNLPLACRRSSPARRSAAEHFGQRRDVGPEDGLALLVAQQAEVPEDGGQALKVLRGEQRIDALLQFGRLGGGFLEAIEDLREHLPRISAALLPTSTRDRRGYGRCRGSRRCPRDSAAFSSRRSSSWWRRLPNLLLGDERRLVRRLRLALLPREHLLGAEELPFRGRSRR